MDINITVTSIQGVNVSSTPPTTGQVLQFNGTEYVPSTLPISFSPTNISGLQLWLRADLGITLSGSNVTNWNDQSGVGDSNRNMAQSGSACPTYNISDSSYNNQPTLSFTSTNSQCLNSSSWTSPVSEPFTVIIVGNVADISNNYIFMGSATSDPYRQYIASNITSGNAWQIYNGNSINGDTPNTLPIVFYSEFNGASSTIRISQETPQATGNDSGDGTLSAAGIRLGSDYYNTWFLNGKIAEVIAYNSILSTGDRINLQSYLQLRYAISIGS